MKMKNSLPGRFVAIENQPVSIKFQIFCNFFCSQNDLSCNTAVFITDFFCRGYMVFGYDQNMHRRLGREVVKGHNFFFFVNNCRGNLFPGYFTEDAACRHCSFSLGVSTGSSLFILPSSLRFFFSSSDFFFISSSKDFFGSSPVSFCSDFFLSDSSSSLRSC